MEENLSLQAKKKALRLLERMDRSEAQLREKLRQNQFPEEAIEEAITYVKQFHYIDDFRYACNYVRYRCQDKSKRLLSLELTGKGVSKELIDRALEEEYVADERNKICKWMEKRHYDPQKADIKEKQKMYQFLMRKGFQSDDILKELQ